MNLVVLGSGTSVPHAQRASSAYWLETRSGSLLLDISPDAAHRMAEEGLEWPALDAIWASHFHLDHVGGLAPFLFGTKWAPQTRNRSRPLKIFGPDGTRAWLDAIDGANNYRLLQQAFSIEVIEVAAGAEFEALPSLRARTLSTPHTDESLAIRLIEADESSFVYTSDTGYAEELADFARGVDLLLMECSFRRNKPMQTHLDLAEAMRLAQIANPKRVLLTHLYPEWDGRDLVAEAKALWTGETIAAVDGLRLEV
jgi:ribonuclease BN (tRNA processing enzyme)